MIIFIHTTTLLLVIAFLAYVLAILRSYLRARPNAPADPSQFAWHLFVPACDEALLIDATIRSLRTDVPEAEVWVVDDGSRDDTGAIVGRCAQRDGMVHLVSRLPPDARAGKGAALNCAYRELVRHLSPSADHRATIVGVLDADSRLGRDALARLAGPQVFGAAHVGAAQTAVWISNVGDARPRPTSGRLVNLISRTLVRMQDIEFRTAIAAMQLLRLRTGSVGLGGNGQFTRLSVLDEIAATAGDPWHGALLEDYELGLHVMLSGYVNRYVHDSWVRQEGVTTVRRLVTQRTRWAQGNLQCIKYLPRLVRSPHFGSAALLESVYFLLLPYLQLLGLFVWPTAFALFLTSSAGDSSTGAGWLAVAWPILVLAVLFGVLPFALWAVVYRIRCERCATAATTCWWGLSMWLYTYYVYASTARAFARLLLRRSNWVKTRRNGEPDRTSAGPAGVVPTVAVPAGGGPR